jgi:hypothetical protein
MVMQEVLNNVLEVYTETELVLKIQKKGQWQDLKGKQEVQYLKNVW